MKGITNANNITQSHGGSLSGAADPTTATAGEVGQFYLNTTTNKLFQCQNVDGDSYTWGVPNVNAVTLDNTTQSFSSKKTLKLPNNQGLRIYNQNTDEISDTSGIELNPLTYIGAHEGTYIRLLSTYFYANKIMNSSGTINYPSSAGTLALISDIDTAKSELQSQIGDIGTLLDIINGKAV